MDMWENPFAPGAGAFPPELVGRDDVLDQARILLGRVKRGRAEKNILLTGLRGVGKTVLLNEMERIAQADGYHTVSIEAHEQKSLGALLVPPLRELLYRLDRIAGAGHKARQALAVLKSFVGAIKFRVEGVEVGLDIKAERGTADSGDLEIDLPVLFAAVAEAAAERGSCVAVLIDEVQYLDGTGLSALIMSMHKMRQRKLPLVLIGAGLPVLPGMAGASKSYAERLFSFPEIDRLSEPDTGRALQDPVAHSGVAFTEEAIRGIYRLTLGYPYFIQEWGYQAWGRAESSPIGLTVLQDASETVTKRLDESFFRVRFDRLTPGEKRFLRAMAELGPGEQRSSDVADLLSVRIQSIGPTRAKLINKGMIYSPAHGYLEFTVPLFDAFMQRTMPELE